MRAVAVWLLGLIQSKDGSLSQSKLAGASFHLSLFVTVLWLTYTTGKWDDRMWEFYGIVAVGHTLSDKALAGFVAFQNRKLDRQPNEPPVL